MGNLDSVVDLRLNYLSCCGIPPFVDSNNTFNNVSYSGYNLSMPRLPKGLAFSSILRAVSNNARQISNWNLGNTTYIGMRCDCPRYFAYKRPSNWSLNVFFAEMADPMILNICFLHAHHLMTLQLPLPATGKLS